MHFFRPPGGGARGAPGGPPGRPGGAGARAGGAPGGPPAGGSGRAHVPPSLLTAYAAQGYYFRGGGKRCKSETNCV